MGIQVTARQIRMQLLQSMPELLMKAVEAALGGDNQVLMKLLSLGVPLMSMKDDPYNGPKLTHELTQMERFDKVEQAYYDGELSIDVVKSLADLLISRSNVFEATEVRRRLDAFLGE